MFLPLIVASVLSLGPSQDGVDIVRTWIADVMAHQPGTVDKPLLDVAAQPPANLDMVRRLLRGALTSEPPAIRNDIFRRGALVHTDIALLLPERAARYLETGDRRARITVDSFGQIVDRRDPDVVIFAQDGEYLASAVPSAHWSMARMLLQDIYPRPSADEFVHLWYRAVAAYFGRSYLLGNARLHLTRAVEVLPHDPMVLFYAGAMHEAYGSERAQSVIRTRPAVDGRLGFLSAQEEWRLAERLLDGAVKANAPPEAQLRHARVLGRLGKHAEAVAILRVLEPQLTDRRLRYLSALFLGSEEGTLGHTDQASDAFERAAALFPSAQSPLVAMADLVRRAEDRPATLTVLGRIQALPQDPKQRVDPWVEYFRSFALDAADQLVAVRAWVNRKEPQ